jgi:anion-transporting  ArsA/GET3 family ATPase
VWAFAQGVAERTEEEVLAIIRDPAGEIVDVVVLAEVATSAPTDPRTYVQAAEQAREIRDYVVAVYTEGEPRDASRRVGRDAGRLTAEIVVGRGKRLAARKIRERLRRRDGAPGGEDRDGSERLP